MTPSVIRPSGGANVYYSQTVVARRHQQQHTLCTGGGWPVGTSTVTFSPPGKQHTESPCHIKALHDAKYIQIRVVYNSNSVSAMDYSASKPIIGWLVVGVLHPGNIKIISGQIPTCDSVHSW